MCGGRWGDRVIALLFRLAVTFAPLAIGGRQHLLWAPPLVALVFFEIISAIAPDEAPLRVMALVLWLVVALVCVGMAVLS
jgi:hypothetical protein